MMFPSPDGSDAIAGVGQMSDLSAGGSPSKGFMGKLGTLSMLRSLAMQAGLGGNQAQPQTVQPSSQQLTPPAYAGGY